MLFYRIGHPISTARKTSIPQFPLREVKLVKAAVTVTVKVWGILWYLVSYDMLVYGYSIREQWGG